MHAELNQVQKCSGPEANPGVFLTPPPSPATSRKPRQERQEKPHSLAQSNLVPRTPPASPLKGQGLEGDKKNKADQLWISSLESLKDQLGIRRGRCRALTSMNKPCTKSVYGKMAELDELIRSMSIIPTCSPQLENKFNELVSLTLCHVHQNRISSTLANLLDSFPTESNIRQTSWSVTVYIKHILPGARTKCLAEGHDDDSRNSKLGGRNVQAMQEILKKITAPDVYSNDSRLQAYLEALGQYVFCDLHREQEKPTHVKNWISQIQAIRPPNKSAQLISTDPVAVKIVYPNQVIGDDIYDLTNIEKIAHDISPFTYVDQGSPISVKCIQTALKPKSGSPEGYVYAYEVEGNPGFVKIGYTGFTTQERFEDIAFMCNRKPIGLYPIPVNTGNTIKNPKLVEALCHAQLREHQVTIDCHACLRKHKEWFHVSREDAIGTVQKWSSWMEKVAAESNWRQWLGDKIQKNQNLGQLLKELEGETL